MLAARPIIIDETTVQVLKEPCRDPTSTSYVWVFGQGDPDKQALLYQYHPTNAGDLTTDYLDEYTGYIQTDGYSEYDVLDHKEGVTHIGYFAHARRYYFTNQILLVWS